MAKARTVACPNCGNAVAWTPQSRWRPFCSERCKMIDVGGWASESYRVPTADAPDPHDSEPSADEPKKR
jgi:endogenous inhibitor of DNA gyrase (YacG/DUF329 family)